MRFVRATQRTADVNSSRFVVVVTDLHVKNAGDTNRVGNTGETQIGQIELIAILQVDTERRQAGRPGFLKSSEFDATIQPAKLPETSVGHARDGWPW